MQNQEEGVSQQLNKQYPRMTTSLNRRNTKKLMLTQKQQHFKELLKSAKVKTLKMEVQKIMGPKKLSRKRNLQTVEMTT